MSHKSAWKAEELGYTNVKVFADGFPAWMKAKGNYSVVSVEYVAKQFEENGIFLVDSRPKRMKFDKGAIPSAISIPDSEFDKYKGRLPADKSTQLVFYCGGFACKLSHSSAQKAIQMGYTDVKVFAAGYPAWKKAFGAGSAMKVASAKPAVPKKIKAGKEEGSIDIETFKQIIAEEPDAILLIDVRDPDEFAGGSFNSAVNIPVDELEEKLGSLPSNKPIVFICATGARSGESYYMSMDVRPELKDIYYLDAQTIFEGNGVFKITKP